MSKDVQSDASKERRDAFIRVFEGIAEEYLKFRETPEGKEQAARVDALYTSMQISKRLREMPPPPVLTDNERKALRFIRSQQRRGRMPTVREVAKAVGLRSSRSGAKVVNQLIWKKVMRKDVTR